MKLKLKMLLVLVLLALQVSYSQTYKTILQHQLLTMDPSTLENMSYDTLKEILSDYDALVSSSIREGYSYYPCEKNPLFNQLLGSGGPFSKNSKLYLSKLLETCIDMQNKIEFQDETLSENIETSKTKIPQVYQECFKEIHSGMECGYEKFKRVNRRTLFIQEQKRPSPLHFLSTGLYPVGVAMMGVGIHGLQELNKDNSGSGLAYGAGMLYFFDIVLIAIGTVPIGGATWTIVNYTIKKRKYKEYVYIIGNSNKGNTIRPLLYRNRFGKTKLKEIGVH